MARESSKPRSFLVGLWLAGLALTLIYAPAVASWLVHDRTLGQAPMVLRLAGALTGATDAVGASSLGDGADEALASARPDVVWLRERTEALAREPLPPVPRAASPDLRSRAEDRAPLLSGAAQRRVLLIGASSMQLHFGAELERILTSSYRDVSVTRFGKLGTGLVRPDYFDWPAKTKQLVDERRPDVVIAQFGGNDAQNIAVDGGMPLPFGTPGWDAELGRRVEDLVELVQSRGARFIMVGMPMMRERRFSKRMQHVNEVIQRSVERSGGRFVATWDLSGLNGKYKSSVTVEGATHLLRQSDGVHFTRAGAIYMARKVTERLERELLLVPADESRAIVVRREIASRALGRRVPYLAYVPQPAARGAGALPVLLLLHGADGSFVDWSEHAQTLLQTLSVRHGLVIVTPEGGASGWYVDSARVPDSNYATHIEEVLADVDATLPAAKGRGIAGVSAGGHGALTLALKRPGVFSAASSMSGVVDLTAASGRKALVDRLGPYAENRALWEESSARHLVRRRADVARAIPMLVTVGSSDRWAPENRAFVQELSALGVTHAFEEYDGGHDWRTFTRQLPRHVAWHGEHLRGAGAVSSAPPTR